MMSMLYMGIVVAMLMVPATSLDVTADSTVIRGKHYFLFSAAQTLAAAEASCASTTSNGVAGRLAGPYTAQENDALTSMLYYGGGDFAWTAGRRDAGTSTWRWFGPTSAILHNGGCGPTMFCNSFDFTAVAGTAVSYLLLHHSGRWEATTDTAAAHPYACEFPQLEGTLDAKHLRLLPALHSHSAARTACAGLVNNGVTGTRATVMHSNEDTFMKHMLLQNSVSEGWLGATRSGSNFAWSISSGVTNTFHDGSSCVGYYCNFEGGSPSGAGDGLSLRVAGWRRQDPATQYAALCTFRHTEVTVDGAKKFRLLNGVITNLGGGAGVAQCAASTFEGRKGAVAVPHAAGQARALVSLITNYLQERCWVGANDVVSEGRWLTSAGHEYYNAATNECRTAYCFWRSGEPNNYGSGEDYAELWARPDFVRSGTEGLNDISGGTSRQTICEYPFRVATTPTKHYQLLNTGAMSFAGARQACRDRGMRLATVATESEQDALVTLWKAQATEDAAGLTIWLGGFRFVGVWYWLDVFERGSENTVFYDGSTCIQHCKFTAGNFGSNGMGLSLTHQAAWAPVPSSDMHYPMCEPALSISQTFSKTLPATATKTRSRTAHPTPSLTRRPTTTFTTTRTSFATVSPTKVPTPTATTSTTVLRSATSTVPPTPTATASATPQPTPTPSLSPSMSVKPTASPTHAPTATTSTTASTPLTTSRTNVNTATGSISHAASRTATTHQSLTATLAMSLSTTKAATTSQSATMSRDRSVSRSLATISLSSRLNHTATSFTMLASPTKTPVPTMTVSTQVTTSPTRAVSSTGRLSSTATAATSHTTALSETHFTQSQTATASVIYTHTLTTVPTLTVRPSITRADSATAAVTHTAAYSGTRALSPSAPNSQTLTHSMRSTATVGLTVSQELPWIPTGTPPPSPKPFGRVVTSAILFGSVCSTTQFPIVPITVLLFIVIAIIRGAVSVFRIVRGDHPENHETEDAGLKMSMLRAHVWAGAVFPAHHYAGVAHTTLLAVHVLCIYAVVGAALGETAESPARIVLSALAAAIVATLLHAALRVPFHWVTIDHAARTVRCRHWQAIGFVFSVVCVIVFALVAAFYTMLRCGDDIVPFIIGVLIAAALSITAGQVLFCVALYAHRRFIASRTDEVQADECDTASSNSAAGVDVADVESVSSRTKPLEESGEEDAGENDDKETEGREAKSHVLHGVMPIHGRSIDTSKTPPDAVPFTTVETDAAAVSKKNPLTSPSSDNDRVNVGASRKVSVVRRHSNQRQSREADDFVGVAPVPSRARGVSFVLAQEAHEETANATLTFGGLSNANADDEIEEMDDCSSEAARAAAKVAALSVAGAGGTMAVRAPGIAPEEAHDDLGLYVFGGETTDDVSDVDVAGESCERSEHPPKPATEAYGDGDSEENDIIVIHDEDDDDGNRGVGEGSDCEVIVI